MVIPTKQALNTKNALTANSTSHVNSKPKIVFVSTSDKKEKGKEKENCKCCDMNFYFILKFVRIQYVQHSCDDSSVPSPQ